MSGAASTGRRVGPERFRARVLEASSFAELAREIERTESDPEGVGIMTRKARIFPVRLEEVPLKAAPLLKQEMLATGADSAHARGIADHSAEKSAVVLLGTWGQYRRVVPKLARQPFQLKAIGEAIDLALRRYTSHAPRTVRGVHRSVEVGGETRVMGVVNVTPDSFSDGGQFLDPERAIAHARTLIDEGADILDLGAESTRPGAEPVPAEEEWRRLGPVVEALGKDSTVPLSVDTRSPEVAERAIAAGADLINDVGGLRDPAMRRAVARLGAPAIVMHMRGTPATMQSDTTYRDVRAEVYDALARSTELALADGVRPEQLLIDPGLGFGKNAEQNVEILAHAGEFRCLGYPVVLGASRKSFLGSLLGGVGVQERQEAGVAAAVVAALHGVDIVRTHDVRATVRGLAVADAVRLAGGRLSAESEWSGLPSTE